MSSSTTSGPLTPDAATSKVGEVLVHVKTDARGNIFGFISRELTFFESHPKVIALGAGVAGLIVGFLLPAYF